MKIVQSKLEYSLIAVILGLVVLTTYLFYALHSRQERLLSAQNERYKSYLIATQLRLSSDELTRLVRTYVATNNPKFEEQFWKVLAIRNGEAPLPDHYDRVYWDFLAVKDPVPPFSDGKHVSLKSQMQEMNFSEEEFSLLEKSQKNSDDLVKLEMIAMNAMKGKFQDKNGNFTITGRPDQKLALEIVHGEKYHKAKISIMEPINEFYEKLDQRTQIQVNEIAEALSLIFMLKISAFVLTAGCIFVLIVVRKTYHNHIVEILKQRVDESRRQREELKQAVNERKKTQDELQSILNKTPDIIYRLNPEGKITFISEAVGKYGFQPEKLIGRSIMNFIHPGDWPITQQRILERRSGKRSANDIEVRISVPGSEFRQALEEASDKKWIPFHVSSEGLYSEKIRSSESFLGTQGIARDISKIRHFEQQVNKLAAVVEQAAEDVVITDREGIIQYVNPRFEKVTGYASQEVIGRTPRIFKSGKHDKAFYTRLWEKITRGEIWEGHLWNKIKDGTLILQDVTITPIFNSAGKLTGYASVRRDITEQIRMQEHLQQAQKMEAIGTLAGGIAHDFNNILAGMIGYTELALMDTKDNPSTQEMLERVLEAGGRAVDLVKQILSFSRSQKGEVKPISPASIVKEVLKLMKASLPSTIEIKQSIASKSYIQADPTHIHQVLMNLCTNAAYAMKEKGGVLSVKLQDVSLDKDDLSSRPDMPGGDYLEISVEDTGTGMAPEIQKKAFDPFFTTKKMDEGTGMGLSTVHGIITDLGGFISLYSELNQGTSIHIFIPIIPKPEGIKSGAALEPIRGGTERILFVDDEQMQLDLAGETLKRYGYQVTTFLDSAYAADHFQQNADAYDLVISDMTMPKMTGEMLIKKIRLERSDIPAIICTGFSEVIDEQKADELKINAFLYKPVIMANLLETIRDVLDKKR